MELDDSPNDHIREVQQLVEYANVSDKYKELAKEKFKSKFNAFRVSDFLQLGELFCTDFIQFFGNYCVSIDLTGNIFKNTLLHAISKYCDGGQLRHLILCEYESNNDIERALKNVLQNNPHLESILVYGTIPQALSMPISPNLTSMTFIKCDLNHLDVICKSHSDIQVLSFEYCLFQPFATLNTISSYYANSLKSLSFNPNALPFIDEKMASRYIEILSRLRNLEHFHCTFDSISIQKSLIANGTFNHMKSMSISIDERPNLLKLDSLTIAPNPLKKTDHDKIPEIVRNLNNLHHLVIHDDINLKLLLECIRVRPTLKSITFMLSKPIIEEDYEQIVETMKSNNMKTLSLYSRLSGIMPIHCSIKTSGTKFGISMQKSPACTLWYCPFCHINDLTTFQIRVLNKNFYFNLLGNTYDSIAHRFDPNKMKYIDMYESHNQFV